MPNPNTIALSKLLIVEGNHERDTFDAWFRALGINDIQILPIGGKTQLAENLAALVRQPNFPSVVSLVIVRDADDNPSRAFQSVADALRRVDLTSPAVAWAFQNGTPRVAVIILPSADRTGALEELLIQTVENDPLHPAAIQLIEDTVGALSIDGAPRRPPPEHRRGKARLHAFLSTYEEPDRDPGKAALAGAWNFAHPALQPLLQILQQM